MEKYEAMYIVDKIGASTRDWLEKKIDSTYNEILRNRYAQEIADLVNKKPDNNTGKLLTAVDELKAFIYNNRAALDPQELITELSKLFSTAQEIKRADVKQVR
jgi:hypothetical protein